MVELNIFILLLKTQIIKFIKALFELCKVFVAAMVTQK